MSSDQLPSWPTAVSFPSPDSLRPDMFGVNSSQLPTTSTPNQPPSFPTPEPSIGPSIGSDSGSGDDAPSANEVPKPNPWRPIDNNSFKRYINIPEKVTATLSFGGTPVHCMSDYAWGAASLDDQWRKFLHFNGSAYFFHTGSGVVVTKDITNADTLAKCMVALDRCHEKLANLQALINWDFLVLEDLHGTLCATAFFLHMDMCTKIYPADLSRAIDHEIKTETYWEYLERFPMHLIQKQLPTSIGADFMGALSFGASERILEWNDTSFPFTDDQIRRLMQVYRELLAAHHAQARVVPALVWHVARTMRKIEQFRSNAKFGTSDYRLYRDVVNEEVGRRVKFADACLFFFFFGAHTIYKTRLQSARVNGNIYVADFRELVNNLLAEWSDSNLLATVFVGANIAFLAVPDITSVQRTASLASTVFSVLSVATGVHHTWQHRNKLDASHADAQRYLQRSSASSAGDADLALMACVLAVPLVALLYAVLSFALALAAFCVQSTDVHGRVLLLVTLDIAVIAGLGTLLFFWHVWRGPRTHEVSEQNTDEVLSYGWVSIAQGKLGRAKVYAKSTTGRVASRMWKATSLLSKASKGNAGADAAVEMRATDAV